MNVPETFFSVSEELRLFFLSWALGGAVGLFYEIFRTLRLLVRHNSLLTAIEDVFFILCWGTALNAFSSALALGRLRGWFVLGSILGFFLYLVTVGRVLNGIVKKFLHIIKKFFSFILYPFRKGYALIRKKAEVKFVGNSKIFALRIKKLKMLLPKTHNLLYNKTENNKRKNVKNVAQKKNFPKKKGTV